MNPDYIIDKIQKKLLSNGVIIDFTVINRIRNCVSSAHAIYKHIVATDKFIDILSVNSHACFTLTKIYFNGDGSSSYVSSWVGYNDVGLINSMEINERQGYEIINLKE